jgi:hypothetical protein
MQSVSKNAQSASILTLILELYSRDHASLAKDARKFCRYLERKYQQRRVTPDDVRIVNAINEGFVSAKDISGHTLIPYETVTKLLNELEVIGAITATRKPIEPGRGGDKKTELHWATDKALVILHERAAKKRAERDAEQKSLLDVIEGICNGSEQAEEKVLPKG